MSAGPRDAAGGVVARAWDVVTLRYRWGLGVAALVLAVSAAVVLLSRPVYRADARLRLGEPPPNAGVSPTGGLLSFLRTGGDPFANDLELLASRTLADAVVRATALSVDVQAPRGWYRDSLVVSLSLADTTAKALFEARWSAPDRLRVRRLAPDDGEALDREVPVGVPTDFGGMRVTFAPRRGDAPEAFRLKTRPHGEAVRSASSRLTVTRTRRDANVLMVSYTHDDPGVALSVVRAAVEEFLRLRTRLFRRESGETVDSLRAVSLGTQRELLEAEGALEAFQRETGLVALDPQSEALVERYETARSSVEAARAEAGALDAQLTRVARRSDPVEAWSVLVAHPRFLENETVGNLLTRLTELHELRTELRTRLQPSTPEMATLDGQIRQLDTALRALVGEYRAALGEGIAELEGRLTTMERALATLPGQLVELGRRQRDVRILSEVLVLTEQRLRQEELRQALAYSNVQVIDDPGLRFRPVWPRKKLGLAAGVLLAMAAGVLTMATVHRADTTLRWGARIRELAGAPVLAAVLPGEEASRAPEATWVACPGVTPAQVPGGHGDAFRVGTYDDAARVASRERPAILVVRAGATTEAELSSVVRLLGEAGARVAGVVALCSSAAETGRIWR
ncbi:MAG: hypothetical protein AMXMBFR53_18040 [Gemmatimonadota bacterium]